MYCLSLSRRSNYLQSAADEHRPRHHLYRAKRKCHATGVSRVIRPSEADLVPLRRESAAASPQDQFTKGWKVFDFAASAKGAMDEC
jgi:hypothetical protein